MSPQVTFHPKGRSIDVPEGTSLLEAAILAGVEVNSACAGNGVCGRCKVIVEGDVESEPSAKVTGEEWSTGYRLACRTKVKGACTVFVPEETQLRPMQIVGGGTGTELKAFTPVVRAVLAKLRPPSLQDNDGDLERLLKGIGCEPGTVEVPLSLLREVPRALREGEWTATAFLDGGRLVDLQPWDRTSRSFGAAVDLGTTTVALQLVDLGTGEMVAQVSDYNRQLMYGEDVLARIMYCEENGGERLRRLAVDTIDHMLAQACSSGEGCEGKGSRVCADEVRAMVVAGNTTMVHLLLGLDPRSIRYEPYAPVTNLPPSTTAGELGVAINPRAAVHLVPGRASYVGGDVVADVIASGMARGEGVCLLIDVGTNGEVVLGNREWLLACSASAGPAFEGGEVRHGMRAGEGAIERVSLRGGVRYSVIGDTRPKGLCGSGLIDLVAQLFLTGALDKKGHLQPSERVREGEDGKEYVLVRSRDVERDGYDLKANGMARFPMDEVERRRDITVTEADIANVIRTKAAIYAAAEVLLDTAGLAFGELERVYIAGGFGHHIDLDNAVAIGLLPDLPRERFTFLGNASLDGAKLYLLSGEMREEALRVHRAMAYVELSTDQRFFERFSSATFLPHTDLSRFPSVK
jgi:uncharacterized 2Fe-2S/4Fe-4S cluster protein (DUF4445 family)